jgi:hypothetical protein
MTHANQKTEIPKIDKMKHHWLNQEACSDNEKLEQAYVASSNE